MGLDLSRRLCNHCSRDFRCDSDRDRASILIHNPMSMSLDCGSDTLPIFSYAHSVLHVCYLPTKQPIIVHASPRNIHPRF